MIEWNDLSKFCGHPLSNETLERLSKLERLLIKWHKNYNLLSEGDLKNVRSRHILDSLMPLHFIEAQQAEQWCDIGSGTGFPLIPMACALPQCQFIGIEPREKRVLILRQMVRELQLKNVKLHCGTAETFQADRTFDICSARAVGSIDEDWQRAHPLLKPDGHFITFKTPETARATSCNGQIYYLPYTLPSSDREYTLAKVSKSV